MNSNTIFLPIFLMFFSGCTEQNAISTNDTEYQNQTKEYDAEIDRINQPPLETNKKIEIKDNIMGLEYSAEWENEVLALVKSDTGTDRLINLLEMAEYTNDKKIVQILIKSVVFYDANIDATFERTLSTIEYSLYYTVLFEMFPEILQKGHTGWIIDLLNTNEGHTDTKEEWDVIEGIANKYLNKKDLAGILDAYQKQADMKYSSYPVDYPFDIFERIFRKLLEEKNDH